MKKTTIMIAMLLIVSTGTVQAADPNISLVGRAAIANPALYQGLSIDVMAGYKQSLIADVSGEAGGIFNYTDGIDDNYDYGAYGLLHYDGDVAIPNPFAEVADWMPDTIASRPFAGGGYLIESGGFWMVGGTVLSCIEIYYREDINAARMNYIGVMFQWKF